MVFCCVSEGWLGLKNMLKIWLLFLSGNLVSILKFNLSDSDKVLLKLVPGARLAMCASITRAAIFRCTSEVRVIAGDDGVEWMGCDLVMEAYVLLLFVSSFCFSISCFSFIFCFLTGQVFANVLWGSLQSRHDLVGEVHVLKV